MTSQEFDHLTDSWPSDSAFILTSKILKDFGTNLLLDGLVEHKKKKCLTHQLLCFSSVWDHP